MKKILIILGAVIGVIVLAWAVFIIIENYNDTSYDYDNSSSERYSSPRSNYSRPKTEAELRQELLQQEQENYTNYLSANDLTARPTLWGGAVVKGCIKNSATQAVFKDVRVQIQYYSKTGTVTGSHNEVIYEYFKPNTCTYFRIEAPAPSKWESFNVIVTDTSY
ncbi:MAG: hypothetical protein LBU90_10845 [Bacteroidales bacterium]|nr:hypothetical protein [Bacteroidales bacterium]